MTLATLLALHTGALAPPPPRATLHPAVIRIVAGLRQKFPEGCSRLGQVGGGDGIRATEGAGSLVVHVTCSAGSTADVEVRLVRRDGDLLFERAQFRYGRFPTETRDTAYLPRGCGGVLRDRMLDPDPLLCQFFWFASRAHGSACEWRAIWDGSNWTPSRHLPRPPFDRYHLRMVCGGRQEVYDGSISHFRDTGIVVVHEISRAIPAVY
jgi:hypothetical protein